MLIVLNRMLRNEFECWNNSIAQSHHHSSLNWMTVLQTCCIFCEFERHKFRFDWRQCKIECLENEIEWQMGCAWPKSSKLNAHKMNLLDKITKLTGKTYIINVHCLAETETVTGWTAINAHPISTKSHIDSFFCRQSDPSLLLVCVYWNFIPLMQKTLNDYKAKTSVTVLFCLTGIGNKFHWTFDVCFTIDLAFLLFPCIYFIFFIDSFLHSNFNLLLSSKYFPLSPVSLKSSVGWTLSTAVL